MTDPPPGSWIEIDADAFAENMESLKREFQGTRMAMVVKADAYGHGVSTIIPLAEQSGIDEFTVFSAHEASHVLEHATDSRIQIMGHIGRNWPWVAEHGLEPWLNDIAEWPHARAAARDHLLDRGPLQIHLEVETGMYRTGLTPDNALRILHEAANEEAVEVRGLCTHLGGAEDERNRDRVEEQLAVFSQVEDEIRDAGLPMPIRHIASSSAALVEPSWRKDMVRLGIVSYGLWPTPEVRHRFESREDATPLRLRRVLTWRSRIMVTQDVPAGSFIGYGKSYCATRDMRIAIVPVGYGDGLTRRLSNAGHLLVRGTRCPIIGPVNMNMVQIDVSHLEDAQPGEDVVLIGAQGEESIGVHSFAEAQEVVDYEFMARLSQDIPRVVRAPALAPGR